MTRIENPRINDWGHDGGLARITVYRTVMDATVPTEWTDRVAAVVRCRDGEYRAIEPIDSAVLADAVIRAAEQNDHIAACRAIADAVTDPRDTYLAGVMRGQQSPTTQSRAPLLFYTPKRLTSIRRVCRVTLALQPTTILPSEISHRHRLRVPRVR